MKLSASLKKDELLKFLEQFHVTASSNGTKISIAYPDDKELEPLEVILEAKGVQGEILESTFRDGLLKDWGWSEKFEMIK